ncbi:MAG: UDP-2,3-diacylglucosamine diphosphatase LpxI [Thermocrinis sp.]|nr:UDP-2,3-diacylglucosamine diphosphatase LpxI [Thermocrinis sp.]
MKVCLVAGSGGLPNAFVKKAKELGDEVFVVGVKGITSIEANAYLPLGKVGTLVKLLEKHHINKIVLLGKFEHKLLFSHLLTLDSLALKILKRAKDRRAQSLIRALMDELEEMGFEFIDPKPYLEELLAGKGTLNSVEPSSQAMEDGLFGFPIAKEIAQLDVGQTIVVKEGTVVSVEAMEGTQEAIYRAGKLAGKGCRVIKVARKNQDFRIDVPTVGLDTLEALRHIKADALFLEAGKVYIVDKDKFLKLADKYKISVVGLPIT